MQGGERHNRQSIRLKKFDYSQPGYYFVTICSYERKNIFGKIAKERMILNELGIIAEKELLNTEIIRQNVEIDNFVVMPNHIHAIIVVCRGVLQYAPTERKFQSPSQTIGAIIRGIKSAASNQINEFRRTPKFPVWQRNYYEHIIRNEKSLEKIRNYILNNPYYWDADPENMMKNKNITEKERKNYYKKLF